MAGLADLYERGYQGELRRQQMGQQEQDRQTRRQQMLQEMMKGRLNVDASDVEILLDPGALPAKLQNIWAKNLDNPNAALTLAKMRENVLTAHQRGQAAQLTPGQMTEQFGAAFPGQTAPTFTQTVPATTFNTVTSARASLGRQASSAEQQKLTRAQRSDFFNKLFPGKESANKATVRLSNATADRIEAELKRGGYKNFGEYAKDAVPMFLGLMVGGGKQSTVDQQTEAQAAASESWNEIDAGAEPNEAFVRALGTHPDIGTPETGLGGFAGVGKPAQPAAAAFGAPPVQRPAAPPVQAKWNAPNPVAAKDLDARVQKVIARLKANGKMVTPEDEAKIREQLSGGK